KEYPFPRAILVGVSSPRVVGRGRFFSHAKRRNVSPRGAKGRGDMSYRVFGILRQSQGLNPVYPRFNFFL
ncbi:hypothetical protein GW17_00038709, partial [Ensete ventricosum]